MVKDDIFDVRTILAKKHLASQKKNICEHPPCKNAATHTSPKAAQAKHVKEYYHLCREHAQEYNQKWNFFDGCSDDFVQNFYEDSLLGLRPTWSMGNLKGTARSGNQRPRAGNFFQWQDPFDIFPEQEKAQEPPQKPSVQSPLYAVQKACEQLKINFPPLFPEAKKQFKILVKKYHPDVNPNNPHAEDMLKKILEAFKEIEKYHEQG